MSSYYSAPTRWAQLDSKLDAQQVALLEMRQRELDQYLGAPPQRLTSPRLLSTDGTLDVTTSMVNAEVRWERQRGQWVTLDFSADGSGVQAANPGSSPGFYTYGITLPPEAPPINEGGFSPCAGSVHFRIGTSLIAEADEPPTLWLVGSVWVAGCASTGFGVSTDDYFRGHIWYLAAT